MSHAHLHLAGNDAFSFPTFILNSFTPEYGIVTTYTSLFITAKASSLVGDLVMYDAGEGFDFLPGVP